MKLNLKEGEKVLQNLLVGMETEFLIYRPSFFILYMERDQEADCEYPATVQVYLPEYWLVGDKSAWLERIEDFGPDVLEPGTLLEAFELTKLVRRTSTIVGVSIADNSVSLRFDNGTLLTSYCPDGEYCERVLMVSESTINLGIGEKWFNFNGDEIWARDLPEV